MSGPSNSFPSEVVGTLCQHGASFFTFAGLGIATWLILRAVSAIVGEYAKAIWFRYVHPDKLTRARLALEQRELSVKTREQELESHWATFNKTAQRLDTAEAEIWRLRQQLARSGAGRPLQAA